MATILVIGEYDGFRDAMEFCLPRFGHRGICAPNVEAALTLAEARAVDMVLMVWDWDWTRGLADCAQLRRDAVMADKPLIVWASVVTPELISRGREAGVTSVVGPNFLWPELLAAIERGRR